MEFREGHADRKIVVGACSRAERVRLKRLHIDGETAFLCRSALVLKIVLLRGPRRSGGVNGIPAASVQLGGSEHGVAAPEETLLLDEDDVDPRIGEPCRRVQPCCSRTDHDDRRRAAFRRLAFGIGGLLEEAFIGARLGQGVLGGLHDGHARQGGARYRVDFRRLIADDIGGDAADRVVGDDGRVLVFHDVGREDAALVDIEFHFDLAASSKRRGGVRPAGQACRLAARSFLVVRSASRQKGAGGAQHESGCSRDKASPRARVHVVHILSHGVLLELRCARDAHAAKASGASQRGDRTCPNPRLAIFECAQIEAKRFV